MYSDVTCKLCEKVLGTVHRKDADRLFTLHFSEEHPVEWQALREAKKAADEAVKNFRTLRAELGVTMNVAF